MDEDLIIVDDLEDLAGPSTAGPSSAMDPPYTPVGRTRTRPMRTAAEHAMATNFRHRDSSEAPDGTRSTRASTLRQRPPTKLKLKLSEKAAAQAPGMSFLGAFDRELDSDDEDLAFEEQFILRMPPGEDCEKLRRMVNTREVGNDVWFKFKDSRRAVFHIGNSSYASKLVDLPCIVESHKTLDNKQMFKVADICQMLVVENKIENEDVISRNKNLNIDEFIWPHGITPPLHHVRKRRFRKRVNKRTIESVEEEVERLLGEDALASEVKYDILENVNPDLSDSEFIERDEPLDAPTPFVGSDAGDAPTPGGPGDDGEEADEQSGSEGEGDIDEELAAELDLALEEGQGDDEEEDDDDDDDDDDSEEEEDEDEDDEAVQARKLLNEEIADLEAAVKKKGNEIASSANPLIKRRFEDALKKLTADLEMKLAQRDEMKEQQRLKKAGVVPGGPSAGDTDGDGEGPGEDVDLFGDEDEGSEMDVS